MQPEILPSTEYPLVQKYKGRRKDMGRTLSGLVAADVSNCHFYLFILVNPFNYYFTFFYRLKGAHIAAHHRLQMLFQLSLTTCLCQEMLVSVLP